jgi:hypothetical protein
MSVAQDFFMQLGSSLNCTGEGESGEVEEHHWRSSGFQLNRTEDWMRIGGRHELPLDSSAIGLLGGSI